MPFVYSTATAGNTYTEYKRVTKDLNQPVKSVAIAGGSNVATKNLITPLGVVTEISEDELEFLLAHPVFKRHMEKGFMRVQVTKKDPEKIIAQENMEIADESAPLTPETLDESAQVIEKETHTPAKRGRKKKVQ